MSSRYPWGVWWAVALALVAGSAAADDVQLSASKGNTLFQDDLGSLSNGAGQYYIVGVTHQTMNAIRRGLIAFDIAGSIPAGSTIQGVSLMLHCSQTLGPPLTVDLRSALADWGEGTSNSDAQPGVGATATPGDATWLHTFYDTALWTNPGGDFSAASASAFVSGVGFYAWSSAGLVADVQGWLDDPATNFGWGIISNYEGGDMTAHRLDTRHHMNPAFQPVLSVTYTPAAP